MKTLWTTSVLTCLLAALAQEIPGTSLTSNELVLVEEEEREQLTDDERAQLKQAMAPLREFRHALEAKKAEAVRDYTAGLEKLVDQASETGDFAFGLRVQQEIESWAGGSGAPMDLKDETIPFQLRKARHWMDQRLAGIEGAAEADRDAALAKALRLMNLIRIKTGEKDRFAAAVEIEDMMLRLSAGQEPWAPRNEVVWQVVHTSEDGVSVDSDPAIDRRPIRIEAVVEAEAPNGVVVAQGGRINGFCLHFVEGFLVLDIRRDGALTGVRAVRRAGGRLTLGAEFLADRVRLRVNGDLVAQAVSPGLFPVQPGMVLQIGEDVQEGALGAYPGPHTFNGRLIKHKIETGPVEAAASE